MAEPSGVSVFRRPYEIRMQAVKWQFDNFISTNEYIDHSSL
jgi:hypothetical protein